MKQMRPVILIEDDSFIRESLCDLLESEGFKVQEAENGKLGLELIRSYAGDCVVLLDLQMPVMTGEELLEALSREEDPKIRTVPVLVLTARGQGFHHPGIIGTLLKPFDLDQLLEKVKTLFSVQL